MNRQTLSIMEACAVVGVSRRTIYNWIAAGKLEYVRTAGGRIRIFADSLWRDAAPASAREIAVEEAPEPNATRVSLFGLERPRCLYVPGRPGWRDPF